MEMVGTGKSYLIKTIWNMIHEMVGIKNKTSVLIFASTVVVAFNIRDMTIHSMLFIPINSKNNIDTDGK